MNPSTTEKIADLYPNIKPAKKLMSWIPLHGLKSRLISEKERKAGERSDIEKQRIVDTYIANGKKRIKGCLSSADTILAKPGMCKSDADRKQKRMDMAWHYLAYGFQPNEYIGFELEHQTLEQKREWVSCLDHDIITRRMNDMKGRHLLTNKSRTYERFKMYFGRIAIDIKTEKDYDAFQAFVSKYPVFVKKPVFRCGGKSVELVDINAVGMSQKEYFTKLITQGEHILEEKIEQSDALAKFNPSSVNTVRMVTFLTRSGVVNPFSVLRCGHDGSFVDNGAAGGILVGINRETGVLETDGYDEDNHLYLQHPNTKITFRGQQLPEWENLLKICKEVASQLPDTKYIGFDLAHTKNGWVIVEMNESADFGITQIAYHRGMKKELEAIMSNMDLIL